jgi:hypothetical protein
MICAASSEARSEPVGGRAAVDRGEPPLSAPRNAGDRPGIADCERVVEQRVVEIHEAFRERIDVRCTVAPLRSKRGPSLIARGRDAAQATRVPW